MHKFVQIRCAPYAHMFIQEYYIAEDCIQNCLVKHATKIINDNSADMFISFILNDGT